MTTPTVLSLQVSLPREHPSVPKPWRTGYFKQPVKGPVQVGPGVLEGDGVAHVGAHGGPDRVVLAYSAEHYPLWRQEFPDHEFLPGAFGENLTVSGLDEATVCIGDRHHIGETILEVSIPRSPCPKISRANAIETLYDRVEETRRMGWLYRVIKAGDLSSGQPIVVVPGPNPTWNVERTYDIYKRVRKGDPAVFEDARALQAVEQLSMPWREVIAKALALGPIA
jgi:MOSC domain-containing protein YiiM